jgi:hypothetical protein
MGLHDFLKYYQVCKRCSIAKKKYVGSMDAAFGEGGTSASSSSEPAVVIVRKMPFVNEGHRIRR